MCNAPNSAQWRSAGLRKSESSWHIHQLTKEAGLDYDPKMHLCALHLQRSICSKLVSLRPWGDWQSRRLPPGPGSSSTTSSWCHTAVTRCNSMKCTERSGEKSSFSFYLWTVPESLCPWERGSPWGTAHVHGGDWRLRGVFSPALRSTLAEAAASRKKWPWMGPSRNSPLNADVVLCHRFGPGGNEELPGLQLGLENPDVGFDLADRRLMGFGGYEGSSSFYSGLLSSFFHAMYGNILFVNGLFLRWNTVSVEK